MTGLEIALLTIGLIVIVASFVFSSKSDGDTIHNVKDVTFTDKQKEDIKKQITDILDEQIENVKEQTEISLDKLSMPDIKCHNRSVAGYCSEHIPE